MLAISQGMGDSPLSVYVVKSTALSSPPLCPTGTYAGMIEKLDYLQQLGINAIELLPVQEFNELEYYSPAAASAAVASLDGGSSGRFNFWGYSTSAFFAPMARSVCARFEGQKLTRM